jgi:arginine decarboxylase
MKIYLNKGVGTGATELAAFDQALVNANVANFNLIYLSSVLPPDSEVIVGDKEVKHEGDWGDRLYVVMAQMRTMQRNQEAWAGIGWMQDSVTNKGLLVEHEGHTEAEVRADIENSLKGLAANRHMKFGPIHMEVNGVRCENDPVCALVVAVFESHGWHSREAKPEGGPNLLRRLARKV